MFDFGLGTTELLFIAIVAIIVVGPKDLPRLLRTIGNALGKIKSMAREFQGHLEEAARETGIDDLKNEVKKATEEASVDITGGSELKQSFEDIGKDLQEAGDAVTKDTPTEEPAKAPAKKSEKPASKKTVVKKAAKKPPAKKASSKSGAKKAPAKKSAKASARAKAT